MPSRRGPDTARPGPGPAQRPRGLRQITDPEGDPALDAVNRKAPISPPARSSAIFTLNAAVNALLGQPLRPVDHRVIPRAIFTDPQIGVVGMTEEQALAAVHYVSGGSHSDSASVIQYHDNGGSNQRWALTWVSGTGFKLRNVNSGKNWDVYGGSRADYATVVQYCDNGGGNHLGKPLF